MSSSGYTAKKRTTETDMYYSERPARHLIAHLLLLAALLPVFPLLAERGPGTAPEYATIENLSAIQRDEPIGAVQLTAHYLARIDRLNSQYNAVIATNPDAVKQARLLDEERRRGQLRGPLHGIPVLLKDNIESVDPLPTTAGSLALNANFAAQDAGLVKRLRDAGLVILGKANLSEWANFRSGHSVSGWSAVGGQTHNAYDRRRNPCGSSSGSAVSVALDFAPLAVGTETDGSVVCPSSANGVVGIKPTLGLVSRSGIVPIAHSQDTAGPMAKTVSGAVALLQAMQGADRRDPLSVGVNRNAVTDYRPHLKTDGLNGKRIGVARQMTGFHPAVEALINDAIEVMRAHGAEIVDPVHFETYGEFGGAEYQVLLHEFKADLNAYLASTPKAVETRTLEQLIAFNDRHADREMPWFGQDIFHEAQSKGDLQSKEYRAALKTSKRLAGKKGIDAVLRAHRLDAIISATGSAAWVTDMINGDHFIGSSSRFPAVAGYPHITVPMGFIHGLPVGLSIYGGHLSEPVLIEVAYGFEQATGHWRPPEIP